LATFLANAGGEKRARGINLMSDNGSQPISQTYEKALETLGITHTATSYSNPKGNAETERVIRTLKEAGIRPYEFDSLQEAGVVINEEILFYNTRYPHSSLGELNTIEFERLTSHQDIVSQAA
jgi:putative transposase